MVKGLVGGGFGATIEVGRRFRAPKEIKGILGAGTLTERTFGTVTETAGMFSVDITVLGGIFRAAALVPGTFRRIGTVRAFFAALRSADRSLSRLRIASRCSGVIAARLARCCSLFLIFCSSVSGIVFSLR